MLSGIKDLSYQERLQTLKLPSLEHRRRRWDMIDVFKYLKGLYNTDTSVPFLQPAPKEQDTRGNSMKLFKSFAKSRVRCAYFAERVILECSDAHFVGLLVIDRSKSQMTDRLTCGEDTRTD